MNETLNNAIDGQGLPVSHSGINERVSRVMIAAIAAAVIVSAVFAPWRFTNGLLLGGALSVLNYRWLTNSIAATFARAEGLRPKIRIAQYVLRYIVIAAAVGIAYKLNLVSLAATIFGLCSFVVALFAEALRESYLIITKREGIN